jgi:hypothetical protein
MWQVEKIRDGLTIVDKTGKIIAKLPDDEVDNASRLAALPDLLAACQGDPGKPLPESLRQLAAFLGNLANGPFSLPLDQMMRLTNDLQGWQVFLKDLADRLEKALPENGQ